jgi:hypothetical protein
MTIDFSKQRPQFHLKWTFLVNSTAEETTQREIGLREIYAFKITTRLKAVLSSERAHRQHSVRVVRNRRARGAKKKQFRSLWRIRE